MLCNHHKSLAPTSAVGRCQSCGGSTFTVGVKLCVTCSVAKKQCQVCRTPINQAKDADK